MTEYALILAAVAVVVFVTYEVQGQKIKVAIVRRKQRRSQRGSKTVRQSNWKSGEQAAPAG